MFFTALIISSIVGAALSAPANVSVSSSNTNTTLKMVTPTPRILECVAGGIHDNHCLSIANYLDWRGSKPFWTNPFMGIYTPETSCIKEFSVCQMTEENRRCVFTQPLEYKECLDRKVYTPALTPSPECVQMGNKKQYCVHVDEPSFGIEDIISSIESGPFAFSCFDKYSVCTKQPNGLCGWTHTQQLRACLRWRR